MILFFQLLELGRIFIVFGLLLLRCRRECRIVIYDVVIDTAAAAVPLLSSSKNIFVIRVCGYDLNEKVEIVFMIKKIILFIITSIRLFETNGRSCAENPTLI